MREPGSAEKPERPGDSRRWLAITVPAALAFLLLSGGSFALGMSTASSAPAPVVSMSPSDTATPVPDRSRPAVLPDARAIRTCRVAPLAADDALATFSGHVSDTASGKTLFSRDGSEAAASGGSTMLVTAAAALQVLGPDFRMRTRVVAGTEPGSIVLVGGGDPTLSRLPAGEQSVYPDAPRLDDLVAQVRASLGEGAVVTSIIVDSSFWTTEDEWDESWPTEALTEGRLSKVSALQVDGDRKNPKKKISPRSADPAHAAGVRFAAALGVPGAAISAGTASPTAARLAEVQSQPVSNLINTMLTNSDATLAEVLARVTSKQAGGDGSRDSLATVLPGALADLGLDASAQSVFDGSGLSPNNAISPAFVADLLTMARSGAGDLGVVYNSLSIAGSTGPLASRFDEDDQTDAVGQVRAFVGSRDGEYTLSGIIDAADGSHLAFAFRATGDGLGATTSTALDSLAAAAYRCGMNLSNK
jgi:D-alanyl-D-alanine carboxypeptidase/D-alanyl-D-alanine-endopeptidase (penicillin-binding protein 4)